MGDDATIPTKIAKNLEGKKTTQTESHEEVTRTSINDEGDVEVEQTEREVEKEEEEESGES